MAILRAAVNLRDGEAGKEGAWGRLCGGSRS